MSKLRVACFSVSVDGYAAGPDQSLEQPLGARGFDLHQWVFKTRSFHEMTGTDGGEEGIDNDFAVAGAANVGATIMGRNMFGPIRGPWPDDSWKGWWGEEPPYHTDVFVLTHHPREPLSMAGGTTFYFVTDGIHAALERAREAAGDRDIRLGGGTDVIRQYISAGFVDEIHLVVSPVLLGRGEHLFQNLDLAGLGYKVVRSVHGERALHVVMERRNGS
jgi:dihydrofolate reductase